MNGRIGGQVEHAHVAVTNTRHLRRKSPRPSWLDPISVNEASDFDTTVLRQVRDQAFIGCHIPVDLERRILLDGLNDPCPVFEGSLELDGFFATDLSRPALVLTLAPVRPVVRIEAFL